MAILVVVRSVLHPSPDVFVLYVLLTAVAFNVLAAWLFARWLDSLGFTATQRLFGITLYLLNPWLVNLTLTGIETPLFLACLFAFFIELQNMIDDGSDWIDGVRFGLWSGALMLARTDSIFFTIPAFALVLLKRPRSIGSLFLSGIIASAILLPWLLWNVLAFRA